jgi:hypothetical protein
MGADVIQPEVDHLGHRRRPGAVTARRWPSIVDVDARVGVILDRYSFAGERFYLLLHAGLSRRTSFARPRSVSHRRRYISDDQRSWRSSLAATRRRGSL